MDLFSALSFSRYAARALAADPPARDLLAATVDSPLDWSEIDAGLEGAAATGDLTALSGALRKCRRRVMLHTIARDLTGRGDLAEVCSAMTRLADTALRIAVSSHHKTLVEVHGEPLGDDGSPQQLIVIGMGKLGGGELNVSSDVDLIFVYPEDGETTGGRRISNREFFDKLGRRVIGALDDVTSDGFVFRVDMRLRPYGDSGPLSTPFSGLEQYLVTQGRAWERYAWLKARPLTGGRHSELEAVITPFVYRKYLDFDVYDGLRDIHRQIREQGRRRDYEPDIKLGPGGIREIEFTTQALQIVRGGREPSLRQRGTLPALGALAARGLLPDRAVGALKTAYLFLRNLEHRLQYRDDLQTQLLPVAPDERAALAHAMGYDTEAAFDAALAEHRAHVKFQFDAVFGEPAATNAPAPAARVEGVDLNVLAAIWREEVSPDSAVAAFAAAGFADPAALVASLARIRTSSRYLQLPVLSRQRFDTLIPQLLTVALTERVPAADPQTVFNRLVGLLEAVSRRSAYLALIIEHPPLLPRLVQLMGGSEWAADYLIRHPILLDELLDARVLLTEPDAPSWRAELGRMLADHADDPEQQMNTLRHFQHAQTFRLLAQDLAGLLTVERLADHLSALADTVLDATLAHVWAHMPASGGAHREPKAVAPPKFAIIGYGKLGGKELGYASDLDLVFLYDHDDDDDDGDDDDQAPVRYARLAQRLVTWLTSTTAAGPLYDTDLRLRPDGAAGLTVSPLAGFRRYQREHAWTWEHQALTRARFVAGDATIGAAFEAERDAILRLPRDPAQLRTDVIEMRRKMLAGHPNPTAQFDLKHDPGGMVDVEFAVQYLVLAHAHEHPSLTRNAGNIALLAMAGDLKLIPWPLALAAADAYRDYRRLQHQIRLSLATHARVEADSQAPRRAAVHALWHHVFGTRWA